MRIYTKIFISAFYIFILSHNIYAKTLKIMHQENYYPYAFVNEDNESDGIIIDYWKLWAKKKNIDIKFVHYENPDYLQSISSGDVDIISGIKYNSSWTDSIVYTEYIIKVNTTLFLRKDKKDKTQKNIDFKIATIDNKVFNYHSDSVFDNLDFMYYDNFNNFIDDIQDKKIEGFIYDTPIKLNSKKSFKIPPGYYKYKVLKLDYIRPAVRHDNIKLQQSIIKGFSALSQEELLDIAEKWNIIGTDNTIITIVVLFIIVILLITFVFIYIIRKYKKAKKTALVDPNYWKDIIKDGESDLIEFKSSLRWDYRQQKPNKNLEAVIAKTISAFLNTEGGYLFIGVDDNCDILGIENDYQSLSKKNSDGFLLALTNIINQMLGKIHHKNISINIVSIDDKDVCVVSVKKSSRPVFFDKNENEEFYIRTSAASQPMSMSETYRYIKTHWD
jgi:hypothetical protein